MARTVRRHDSSCAKRTRSRDVKSRSPCCPGKTDRDDPDLDGIAQRSGSIAHAAKRLDVDAVLIGASRRSAFYHILRGHVLKGLMKRLPRDCPLVICN